MIVFQLFLDRSFHYCYLLEPTKVAKRFRAATPWAPTRGKPASGRGSHGCRQQRGQ